MNFNTLTGISVPAVTTDQMMEIDRIAMHETGPNLWQMMENAGRNLALFSLNFLGEKWRKAKIAILAGSGGNGGGGICAARHLANRNLDVSLLITDKGRLKEVPAFQYKIYQNTHGKEIKAGDFKKQHFDLVIDALIGYSLHGAPGNMAARLIEWCNRKDTPVISLDVPSGVDSTTGETPGLFIVPDATLTLALPKTGLLAAKTGEIYLADIGIPKTVYQKIGLIYAPPFGNKFWVTLMS